MDAGLFAKDMAAGLVEGSEGMREREWGGGGWQVLESMSQQQSRVGPKRRKLEAEEDITGAVRRGEVSEQTLLTRLTEYVERIDTDLVRLNLEGDFLALVFIWPCTTRLLVRVVLGNGLLTLLHHICLCSVQASNSRLQSGSMDCGAGSCPGRLRSYLQFPHAKFSDSHMFSLTLYQIRCKWVPTYPCLLASFLMVP